MRNNGKTYRAVLRAVANASGGKGVIYVSNTEAHIDIAINYASIFTQCIDGVKRDKSSVNFIYSGGLLSFMTLQEYLRALHDGKIKGRKVDEIVEDK